MMQLKRTGWHQLRFSVVTVKWYHTIWLAHWHTHMHIYWHTHTLRGASEWGQGVSVELRRGSIELWVLVRLSAPSHIFYAFLKSLHETRFRSSFPFFSIFFVNKTTATLRKNISEISHNPTYALKHQNLSATRCIHSCQDFMPVPGHVPKAVYTGRSTVWLLTATHWTPASNSLDVIGRWKEDKAVTERQAEERQSEHVKDKMLSSLVWSISFFLIRGTHLSSRDKRRTDSRYFSLTPSLLSLFFSHCAHAT